MYPASVLINRSGACSPFCCTGNHQPPPFASEQISARALWLLQAHSPCKHIHRHDLSTPSSSRATAAQVVALFDFAKVQLAGLPPPVALGFKYVVLPLGRLMGFKATYPEYNSAWGTSAA